ncbi:MAG: hypothetical protein FJ272_10850, partial [Planctomycetes bacterium]|nr:hypothetical protein [Planctomycetota bacterium]
MKAGFARVSITPPLGTPMMGFGGRDREKGCTGVHDDVSVRAAYLEHAGEAALLMGFDLCFVGRADSDRMKAAIGKKLGLAPKQILLNASHNHVGPMVGTWYDAHPSPAYLKLLDEAVLKAAVQAKEKAREVTAWAGATKSAVPMNRRRKDERGVVENRPNPGGVVCDHLPICLLKDVQGKPVCLIFSASCHPSMISGWDISAEYPGAAMDKLDAHLGAPVSLFLQGAGGDAKPSVAGKGVDRWRPCTWADVAQAGHMLADEVIQALTAGLAQVQPRIRTEMTEVQWPMQPPMSKDKYAAIAADTRAGEVRRLWAKKIVEN